MSVQTSARIRKSRHCLSESNVAPLPKNFGVYSGKGDEARGEGSSPRSRVDGPIFFSPSSLLPENIYEF